MGEKYPFFSKSDENLFRISFFASPTLHDPGSGVDSKFLFCIGLKIGIWTLKKSVSEKNSAVLNYHYKRGTRAEVPISFDVY